MCSGCPFNDERVGPPIPEDVWDRIRDRIHGGENWVCHMTCEGARELPGSLLCAGATDEL